MKTFARLAPAARRAQFLDIGIRLFSERPYDDFSMEEVAEAAGVSKGLLYHYFPTKRDYYLAALRTAARELVAITEPEADVPLEAAVRTGLRRYLEYVAGHAAAYRAVLRGGMGTDAEVVAVADEVRDRIHAQVLAGAGVAEPGPMLDLAVRGWVGMVEAVSLAWTADRGIDLERLVDHLADELAGMIERALAADAVAPAPAR